MTINQRLNLYFEFTGLTAPDFYKKIGVNRIEWNGWIKFDKPISVKKLQQIFNACSELNARWLMVGEGEMLNSYNHEQAPVKPYDEIENHRLANESKITTYSCPDCIQKEKIMAALYQIIDSKQETIDSQKIAIESQKHLIASLQGEEPKNSAQNCG